MQAIEDDGSDARYNGARSAALYAPWIDFILYRIYRAHLFSWEAVCLARKQNAQ